jgi:hypothetical protein
MSQPYNVLFTSVDPMHSPWGHVLLSRDTALKRSGPFGHSENGKCIFYVEIQKTIVTKDVGLTKMHIATKNGTMIPNFSMELAQTMVILLESQENSCLVAIFCEEFSYEPLECYVWYFS